MGIAAAVYKNDFEMVMKETLKKSMDNYYDSKSDQIAWDNVQTKLECCGIEGPTDWPGNQRPITCCHKITDRADPPEDFHCKAALPGDEILYSTGCFEVLQMKADMNAKILIGVGIGIAFVEVSLRIKKNIKIPKTTFSFR